jgi:hypothetical protein
MCETGRTQSCGFPAAFRWSRVVYSIARVEGSEWDGAYSTKLVCILMESVWLRLGSGPRRWSGRSVWVFLALGRFAAKNPAYEPWISLDFLDSLVRIETFQWVTRLLAGRIFLPPFPQARKRRNGSPTVLACGSAGLSMGEAYPNFRFSARVCRPSRSPSAASIQQRLALGAK